MKLPRQCLFAFFLFLILFFISAAISIAGKRLILPEAVYYHRFVSSVSGPEAAWVNPAYLGKNKIVNVEYMGEYYDDRFLNNWGAVICGDGLGLAYRHLKNYEGITYNEYIFALGSALSRGVSLGGSYKYIKNGNPFYNKRHFWNIGLIYDKNPQYSLGMMFSNLNRSRIDGSRSDIEQIYSFSYLPQNKRFIFSIEMTTTSSQKFSHALYNYGLDIFPSQNLILYANLDNDKNYQFGFRYNLNKYFIGNQSRINSDGRHTGTTAFTGYSLPPRKSTNIRK
jgi:hypothetical protein